MQLLNRIILKTGSARGFLLAIVVLGLILLVAFYIFFGREQRKEPISKPSPEPVGVVYPSTREQADLLKLMPITVEGQYIFEYEPKSQFYFLRIENAQRDQEIRQEVIDLIKPLTTDGDYCKYGVLVWSPNKSSSRLPGCERG